MNLASAYAETRTSLCELLRGRPEDELRTIVPASPAWTVKDVVAHVTGIGADLAAGTLPPELDVQRAMDDPDLALIRDQMTARQVATRRGRSLESVIDEWEGHLEMLLAMIAGERPFPRPVPYAGAILVTDLAVHAQDVRGALRAPGDRESAGVGVALASYATIVALRIGVRGLPALRLSYGGRERVLGQGDPGATLRGDRYEIIRALSGRRSRDQIREMAWEGDPEPYVDLIPAYGPRHDRVVDD